ncbi:MAG TPA: glycosyltransferase, partial [Puia sp.]
MKFLFFFSFLIIFYSYIGYGLLIYLLVKIKELFSSNRRIPPDPAFEPEVTLLVTAYNEADFIERKIQNCLGLNYPASKLRLLFITDGSTDESPDIVARYPQVILLHLKGRKGKAAAMNRAMKYVETPYVVFSDANTLLNGESLHKMLKHYT